MKMPGDSCLLAFFNAISAENRENFRETTGVYKELKVKIKI